MDNTVLESFEGYSRKTISENVGKLNRRDFFRFIKYLGLSLFVNYILTACEKSAPHELEEELNKLKNNPELINNTLSNYPPCADTNTFSIEGSVNDRPAEGGSGIMLGSFYSEKKGVHVNLLPTAMHVVNTTNGRMQIMELNQPDWHQKGNLIKDTFMSLGNIDDMKFFPGIGDSVVVALESSECAVRVSNPVTIGELQGNEGEILFALSYPYKPGTEEKTILPSKLTVTKKNSYKNYPTDEGLIFAHGISGPGSSGGPCFNTKGEFVGIIFGAGESADEPIAIKPIKNELERILCGNSAGENISQYYGVDINLNSFKKS